MRIALPWVEYSGAGRRFHGRPLSGEGYCEKAARRPGGGGNGRNVLRFGCGRCYLLVERLYLGLQNPALWGLLASRGALAPSLAWALLARGARSMGVSPLASPGL